VHPVNSNDAENLYTVFAENQRGPVIILHKNAVCVHFHVEQKYPDTVLFLNNFVKHMSEKIYVEKGRLDVPLSTVATATYSKPSVKTTGLTQAKGARFLNYDVAKHSGYAVSKRSGPVLVQNNATTAHTLKKRREASHSSGSSDESSYSFMLNASGGRSDSRNTIPVVPPIQSPILTSQIKGSDMQPASAMDWHNVAWTQAEIREFFHPGYPLEMMRNRPKTQAKTRQTLTPTSSKVRFMFTPFSYCRYKEFPTPQMDTMTSTTSLRSEGAPFIEAERIQLREARSMKTKWLKDTGFQTVFRPTSRTEVASPIETEPISHVSRHRFREISKSKWRAGDFKK
jgi:hypothetical protein